MLDPLDFKEKLFSESRASVFVPAGRGPSNDALIASVDGILLERDELFELGEEHLIENDTERRPVPQLLNAVRKAARRERMVENKEAYSFRWNGFGARVNKRLGFAKAHGISRVADNDLTVPTSAAREMLCG